MPKLQLAQILEQIKSDPEALLSLDKALREQKAEVAEAKRAEREKQDAERQKIVDAIAVEMKDIKTLFKKLNKQYQVNKVSFVMSENGDIDTVIRSPLLKSARSGGGDGKPSVNFRKVLSDLGYECIRGEDGLNTCWDKDADTSKDKPMETGIKSVAAFVRSRPDIVKQLPPYAKSAL